MVFFNWIFFSLQMVVVVGIIMNGANVYGYIRCKLGSKKSISSVASNFLGQQIFQSVSKCLHSLAFHLYWLRVMSQKKVFILICGMRGESFYFNVWIWSQKNVFILMCGMVWFTGPSTLKQFILRPFSHIVMLLGLVGKYWSLRPCP